MVGLGLVAATVATIAYVRTREREADRLARAAGLARELRELADGDPVRLAAVEEYEVTLYQRLFYSSIVTPRLRGAAWALLAAVLSAVGAVASRGDGVVLGAVHIAAVVLAAFFGIAAIVYGVLALVHVATTPRVSFSESYDDAPTGDDLVVTETASTTLEKASTREKASTPDTASKSDD
ncbi:hypothetical protein [Gordonia sp. 852002-10350_SCH5691597]|uniref:hypothetical protein n=1 Tax=Gordonia sp. 852002-10350_SCH5691597 TaxID=1834085 RepID=UPI0007EA5FE8|nr:hypothetical protein [Gordonia sp. 852002-10350_SCH5691597]OBA58639.1 hypothetical protein A5777_05995 [Gordonia sp. 852002-10350_SCH5691597]